MLHMCWSCSVPNAVWTNSHSSFIKYLDTNQLKQIIMLMRRQRIISAAGNADEKMNVKEQGN